MQFNNDSELYHVIGSNIKHYREQAQLTQVQLAEQAILIYRPSTLSERFKNYDVNTIFKFFLE